MKHTRNLHVLHLIFLFLYPATSFFATLFPKDQANLHYTKVYFQEEFSAGAQTYSLVLSKDSLFNHTVLIKDSKSVLPAFWVSDLEWGQSYFWKVRVLDKSGKTINNPSVHKFSIRNITTRYFDGVKLKITTNKQNKHQNSYLALDNTRCIFDRKGKAVWIMPHIEGFVDDQTEIRDIKLTADNTITFLAGNKPLEIDLEGNIMWKAPVPFVLGTDSIIFHHDLKKDKLGNYYVLGNKYVYRKVLAILPEDVVKYEDMVKITDGVVYRKTEIGLLLKFDKSNKLIWYWDFATYLSDEDLNHKKSMSGFPNFNSHANAFSINEQGTIAYVGFRDLNRIVKLDIKTKTVITSFGERYPSGDAKYCPDLFKAQHDANVTRHNSILILNNNGSRSGGVSSVIEFRDVKSASDTCLLWKLELNFDTLTKGKSIKGGNVNELRNTNLFVCAGELNRVFEVTRSKEIVWDAFVYSRGKKDTLWQPFPQYRASVLEVLPRYHFLTRVKTVGNLNDSIQIVLTIYNTGNVDDKYNVEMMDVKTGTVIKQYLIPVGKNSSITKEINVKVSELNLQQINLNVSSSMNYYIKENLTFN